jgi:hypothetical protein
MIVRRDVKPETIERAFNIANPVAIAITFALIQLILQDELLHSLALRVLTCAFFCGISFISYSVSYALGRKLEAELRSTDFAFVQLPRISPHDVYTFIDRHVIPLVVAWAGGYLLAYFLAHETDIVIFTAGFIYFIVSRLLTRAFTEILAYYLGEERIEKPRWLFVIGVLDGFVMTCLTVIIVFFLALVKL